MEFDYLKFKEYLHVIYQGNNIVAKIFGKVKRISKYLLSRGFSFTRDGNITPSFMYFFTSGAITGSFIMTEYKIERVNGLIGKRPHCTS